MSSRVGEQIERLFTQQEESLKRITWNVPGDVHRGVQEIARYLGVSWSEAAATMLRGAIEDAREWIIESQFRRGTHVGMKPEHKEALEVGPLHDLYDEAVRFTGFVHGGKPGYMRPGPELQAYLDKHGQVPEGWLDGEPVDYSKPPAFGGKVPKVRMQVDELGRVVGGGPVDEEAAE